MLPKLERRGIAIACAKFDMINVRQAGLRRHNQAFMVQVVHTVADAHGCTATIKWTPIPYIPTVNNPKMVSLVETVAQRFGSKGTWERLPAPTMGAEDFSFLAGVCNDGKVDWQTSFIAAS